MLLRSLSNMERNYVSFGLVVTGVVLAGAADSLTAAFSSPDSLLVVIVRYTASSIGIAMAIWGLVLASQSRVSFQLEGDSLRVCRRSFRKHDIMEFPIADIVRMAPEKTETVFLLRNGETVHCRKPYSSHSTEVLSIIASIISSREQASTNSPSTDIADLH